MTSLEDILDAFRAAISRDLRVALPGRVVRYWRNTNSADVRLQFFDPSVDEDGEKTINEFPILPRVRIAWPRGGGTSITWPLAPGDPVQILFNDFDLSQWLRKGTPTDPGDLRTHHLGGAVLLPGAPANADALGDSATDETRVVLSGALLLGSSSASEPMVLGNAAKQWLDAHVHPTPMGPSGPPTVVFTALSNKHKVD